METMAYASVNINNAEISECEKIGVITQPSTNE
jgi:hypothetical protein